MKQSVRKNRMRGRPGSGRRISMSDETEEYVESVSIPTLVYYLTTAVLFLFFTAQGIEKRRWN